MLNESMNYEIHPAANEFPMLDAKRHAELVADIATNGQRETIKLYRGTVLDGRNRLKACQELGLTPKTATLPDDTDPWSYVWSLNGARRDLVDEQRYLIWADVAEHSAEWQAAQQAIRDEANRKRSEAAKERERAEDGTLVPGPVLQHSVAVLDSDPHPGLTTKAAASKTNKGAVARGDKLRKKRPDLAAKVKTGEMKPADAHREMNRDEVVIKLEDIKVREVKALEGVYDTIVIDPPWAMQKIERDVAPEQVAFDYPTMTEDELKAMTIPCANDCHVWLWTTHKFLPMALRLLEDWGLTYVCCFTWHKNGGFQPFGLPQYNCEFALYARKGSPKFIDTKAFNTCFSAVRGKHSEKPEEFYDVVRRVTAGRRLDMFNRRAIEGFETFGNEAV